MLAVELTVRLNEGREKTPGLWPRTLSLHAREGWTTLCSKQQPFPPSRTSVTVDFMAGEAGKLWKEIAIVWNGKKDMKVTGLSLSLTGIGWAEEGQQNIQGFFSTKIPTGAERAAAEIIAGPSVLTNGGEVKRQRSKSVGPSVNGEEIVVLHGEDGKRRY